MQYSLHSSPLIAGIDEAGRGPLAGPVTAACVCFPEAYSNPLVMDSKKLTPKRRLELVPVIKQHALAWASVSVGPRRIERLNILRATKLAMRLCAERVLLLLGQIGLGPEVHFLVDGNARMETNLSHETIIKGDQKIPSISAASILAKVHRDHLMGLLELKYPGYGLLDHKGYGTELHRQKIAELGPAKVHRASFAGVSEHLQRL